MFIAQLTDLHVRPVGVACNRVSETNMFAERALRRLAALRPVPDVALLTGDLTECGRAAEYQNLAAMLQRTVSLPVYVIPGNHDHRDHLRAALSHLPGVTSHPEYIQYTIEDHPVRIVMLDTIVQGQSHGTLSDEQLAWLEQTLAAQPQKPTLIAMHHPPFITGLKHMDDIALVNAGAFRAVIARHRQVERIVCGHHHRPIVGTCAQAVVSVAPSVAHQVELNFDPTHAGALNFEPPAFQLHLWRNDCGFVSHTLYVEHYPGPFPFLTEPDYPGTPPHRIV